MSQRNLKPLRVAIAVAFLLATAFLFLDFREIGAASISGDVLYLQFVPSFLNFLEVPTLGTAGFMAVLLLTGLFGRVYCSTVCPFGTLQDAGSRIFGGKRLRSGRKQQKYTYTKPHTGLRYGILGLTVLLFVAGNGLLLNILDPFSNFGRILTNLARPAILETNNLAALMAEQSGFHFLYRVRSPALVPFAGGMAVAMLFVAGWLCARHGRLYCNTLCPVGTLLGLFSRISLFRIRFNHAACGNCGLCERACKAGCIDFKARTVDVTRCVNCYNCLAACPDGALCISAAPRRNVPPNDTQTGRRKLLLGLAALGLSLAANRAGAEAPGRIAQSRPTTIPPMKNTPVSPPGSRSIARFTSRCTACHLCVSACPSRVLVPSFLAYGLSGMLQPQMDFQSTHCNYDCTVCSEICPSGAILPLTKAHKQRTQVGAAHFIKKNCVVYTDNTNCGACSEHCPTKAVHMVPYQTINGRRLVIPEVNQAICVGCGGCEHACPTRPYKAIYVDGNPMHKIAEKPIEKKLEQIPDTGKDFPF